MSEQRDNPQTLKADDLTGLRCPKCDYELTGLPNSQCPECGSEFVGEELRSHVKQQENDAKMILKMSRFNLRFAISSVMFQTIVWFLIDHSQPVEIGTPKSAQLASVVGFGYKLATIGGILSGIMIILCFGLALGTGNFRKVFANAILTYVFTILLLVGSIAMAFYNVQFLFF